MTMNDPQVHHLEGAIDAACLPKSVESTLHEGRPIWVRYDLDWIREHVGREALESRESGMWRYRELLPFPLDEEPVRLGERTTPLVPVTRLAATLGVARLWVKDESRMPTGSFKDRGMAVAVNMASAFGRRRFAVPTNGNAGGALAAYGAAAGAESWIFMPKDTPAPNVVEAVRYGAHVFLVDGLITDCGAVVRQMVEEYDCFDMSTLKEPYRIEGKKTMGLELAEQLGWRLPDVVVYPTGGGTGLIGMWKAFAELCELGWLSSATMPRMIAVQSDGCAPIVRAYDAGERFAEPWEDAFSAAAGIRVPAAVGDFMILDAVRESGGCAIAVPDERIVEWQRRACRASGLGICPEGGACLGAIELLRERGEISGDDRVVLFNTASSHKYEVSGVAELPVIDPSLPALPQVGCSGA